MKAKCKIQNVKCKITYLCGRGREIRGIAYGGFTFFLEGEGWAGKEKSLRERRLSYKAIL
jgi:hypothetical protein